MAFTNNQKCSSIFKTDDCNNEKCASKRAIAIGTNISSETISHQNGKDVYYRYTSVPLKDENGNVVAAFEMFSDETESKIAVEKSQKLADYQKAQTEKLIYALTKLSEGELSFAVEPDKADSDCQEAYEMFSKICDAVNSTVHSVKLMTEDTKMLAESAVDGKLDMRADVSKHKGEFRKIVQGVNDTLDSIVRPLNVAAEYVDRISKGDIPPIIVDDYKGDFNEIKHNLNQCINAVNLLVTDINLLSDSAVEGKLNLRANTQNHHGEFQKIIEGINSTIDSLVSFIDNMPVPAFIVNNMFEIQYINNAGAELADRNKYEIIENKLKCYSHINSEVCKTNNCACTNAIKYGNPVSIDTLANPTNITLDININSIPIKNRKGDTIGALEIINDFTDIRNATRKSQKIAEYQDMEINRILDSLNNLASGNVDFELESNSADYDTFDVKAKFDLINNSISICKDSIKSLTDDTHLLVKSAISGNLNYRADELKHQGEYKKIIAGFNNSIDALVNPIIKTVEYIENISNGVIPSKITEDYNGEFNIIKTNLNQLIDNLNGVFDESGALIEQIILGNLQARGNSEKFKGKWSELVIKLNNIIEQVEIPINELHKVLKNVAVNDFTLNVNSEFKGVWNELKNATNDTMSRLEAIQSLVVDISLGNLDRLDDLRKIGRRSQNDRLVPAFIRLMEVVYQLISDVKELTNAAIEGNVDFRANAANHYGEYSNIIKGINYTLDALAAPIEEAGTVLNIMAEGDLTSRMNGDYKGEHKKLMLNINLLGDSLNNLINKILDGVETTAAAAIEINSTSDTISNAAQEQSAQTEEVASAIEEMSRTITENAENAQQTAIFAKKNKEIAGEGGEIVSQTVVKMRDIASLVKESAKNIEKLGESSKQIGEIISVIDDIADQTNLLALNAAIEAARAGEQGRGFAVVADEVRKLAERTTEATKKIATMIKSIQKETDLAVKVMQNGDVEVTNGIELADKAGSALNEIVVSSQQVLDMISHIASANEQQAATSEEITHNVTLIANNTNESTKRIHDIAVASENLTKLTEELRNVVEKFNTFEDQVSNVYKKVNSKFKTNKLLGKSSFS